MAKYYYMRESVTFHFFAMPVLEQMRHEGKVKKNIMSSEEEKKKTKKKRKS